MTPSILFLQHATADELANTDLAVCAFSRREIEAALVGDAVDRLMELSDDDRIARHLEGRLVLIFDGYDDDPRELYEIPEAVRFFRAVSDPWPYWFHFLERRGDSLGITMRLLVDVQVAGRQAGGCKVELDRDALQAQMMRLFEAMNGLHARLGLSAAHGCRSTDEILGALSPT